MARKKDALKPQPAPRPSRSDSKEIVEAILGAVVSIGDGNATMSAIAERSGVGIASLYRYFPTKPAIYAELSRRLHLRFLEGLRGVLAKPGLDLEAAVLAVCQVVVAGQAVAPELRKVLNTDVPPSWIQESADVTFRAAMKEIRGALETRLDPVPRDLDERVFLVFAALRGQVMISMMFPDLAPPHDRLTAAMARSALAILRAP